MNIVFQFSPSWYILFFGFLISWLILSTHRKSRRDKGEFKKQFVLAFIALFIMMMMEIFAVTTDLWHYVHGDWPIILWPTYFFAAMFGYQLLKFVEESIVKP
jgi:glucan phosphoethanolaminetransferase (alkaline phosphatase superfamily)